MSRINDRVLVRLDDEYGIYRIDEQGVNEQRDKEQVDKEILISKAGHPEEKSKLIKTHHWKVYMAEETPYEIEFYSSGPIGVYLLCIYNPGYKPIFECYPYNDINELLNSAQDSAAHGDYEFAIKQGEIGVSGWSELYLPSMNEIEDLYILERYDNPDYYDAQEKLWEKIKHEFMTLNLPLYHNNLDEDMTSCHGCELIVYGHVDRMNDECQDYPHSILQI